jgi:hypothetical protein
MRSRCTYPHRPSVRWDTPSLMNLGDPSLNQHPQDHDSLRLRFIAVFAISQSGSSAKRHRVCLACGPVRLCVGHLCAIRPFRLRPCLETPLIHRLLRRIWFRVLPLKCHHAVSSSSDVVGRSGHNVPECQDPVRSTRLSRKAAVKMLWHKRFSAQRSRAMGSYGSVRSTRP